MFRSLITKRFISGPPGLSTAQASLPKRPLRKIRPGKARPAIYHQFNVQIELSDGSVITRKSQYPKAEIRLIQDQRNCILWNESRTDLVVVDANTGGRMDKFKQKYGSAYSMKTADPQAATEASAEHQADAKAASEEDDSAFGMDDYLDLLSANAVAVQSGGKLAGKQKKSKK
ncbi:ADL375Wp [Eremothecium gossypii ATCC 10895]|uniref:ADL375Wp n=1 Tax=Eremothecium gossypii (strain ATCC 10895 / CBS 109.51 / FGSC 9923 / NRRL Y-1056) TaxID=284811 RepID=Q75BD9_EREGS|nr:mitochondrial 54S ribosomal protein YmL36 [Eremothecium gossypii ATCC 10895]AAS51545.1 ADL375Wp [Eremothecium gossypii ATCC 10895]AEY95841.1 FADL375Wp [Eremothecium gossypii FDAG1]